MRQSLTLAPVLLLAFVPSLRSQQTVTTPGGTVNQVAKFTDGSVVSPSAITELNGNVGLGVVNPYGLLTIGSYSPDGLGNPYKGLVFAETDSNGVLIWTHSAIYDAGSSGYNGALVFATDDDGQRNAYLTEKMRLDPYGRLGIGTPYPANTITVTGGINVDQDDENTGNNFSLNYGRNATYGLTFGNASGEGIGSTRGAGPNVYGLDFFTASTRRFSIANNGNVGIGTANPTQALEVNGSIKLSGTGAAIMFPDGSIQTKAANSTPSNLTIQSSQTDLVISASNLDQSQDQHYDLSGLANSGKMLFGWNALGGRGEQDIVANSGPGAPGGFVFWDYSNAGALTSLLSIDATGKVGVGTSTPGEKLEVNGNVKLTGTGASIYFPDGSGPQSTAWNGILFGGDYAESVDVSDDRQAYEPGDVMVIDPTLEGSFTKSSGPYATTVTGIYSTKPGVVGRRQSSARAHMPEEVPMAMTGIVPTKVTAENGPIRPGDLLVTSSRAGFAMKGTDRTQMLGAVLGKSIGHLDSGVGLVEVVVTLQ